MLKAYGIYLKVPAPKARPMNEVINAAGESTTGCFSNKTKIYFVFSVSCISMIYRMEWIHSVKAVKWTPTDLHTLHTSPPLGLSWYRYQEPYISTPSSSDFAINVP